jgi:predicted Zn-dependent protease
MFARIALLSVVALTVAGCAASPTGRSQLLLVSDAEVNRMGSQAFQQIKAESELSRDRAKVTMVNCITEAIVVQLQEPHAPQVWEVTVFSEDSINAFALPGGYIGVFEGLMKVAEDQHQLAAVIGHEIAHVTARHGAERISRHQATGFAVNVLGGATGSRETAALLGLGAQVGLLLPFGRAQETEADLLGLDYMARAGFNPAGAVKLWNNMEKAGGRGGPPAFLSTHPSSDSRIRDLNDRMSRAMELYREAQARGLRPACDMPR